MTVSDVLEWTGTGLAVLLVLVAAVAVLSVATVLAVDDALAGRRAR